MKCKKIIACLLATSMLSAGIVSQPLTASCDSHIFGECGKGSYSLLYPPNPPQWILYPSVGQVTIFLEDKDNDYTEVIPPYEAAGTLDGEFSDIVTSVIINLGITKLGQGAFYDFKNMTYISFPDTLTEIGDYAFSQCSGLTYIRLPDSLTNIGRNAFMDCSSITSVNIPAKVTNIGREAFWNCSSLESVTITKGVTNIESYAFWGCSSLKKVDIPESVTKIKSNAFSNCKNLESVTIQNPKCELESILSKSTVTIYGYEGSTAQAYAEEHNIKFQSLGEAPIHGDVDGEISLTDLLLLRLYLRNPKSKNLPKTCDMNADGKINVIDLALLKRELLKR